MPAADTGAEISPKHLQARAEWSLRIGGTDGEVAATDDSQTVGSQWPLSRNDGTSWM